MHSGEKLWRKQKEAEKNANAYLSLGRSGHLYLAELHSLVQSYIFIHLRQQDEQNKDIRAEQRTIISTGSNLVLPPLNWVKLPHAFVKQWLYYCKLIKYSGLTYVC